MQGKLKIYNTLSRQKEVFEPLNPPFVGMYVCGPTVYGYPHLGHAKSYVSFDIIYRYLKYLGYKVRYVQNITDVGHMTDNDEDAGEDKITKQSRLEQVEPMEVVEHYMWAYYRDMDALNILRANIAPRPSGHIPEQIKAIEELIKKGFAYEANGSVYFNIEAYNKNYKYGILSGRSIEDMLEGSANRQLEKQSDKKNALDFALWKKADNNHLMRWNSPWGEGFPGWHIECTVMSQKYLGETFDIHGGGNENKFPHHECEIAQAQGITGKTFAKYWLHNNMVTVNGQKMGKSLGNGINCDELFKGTHPLLKQAFSPMAVRFFILQSHYRSQLDFSNDALLASEKAYKRLMQAYQNLLSLQYREEKKAFNKVEDDWIITICNKCHDDINDDFNSAQVIGNLFELSVKINAFKNDQLNIGSISKSAFEKLQQTYHDFIEDILGLKYETKIADNKDYMDATMHLIIELREQAREKKDFATADKIRDELSRAGIELKDGKDGTSWIAD